MYFQIVLTVIGGLGLLLYGMTLMSDGMRKVAGPNLKKILTTLTTNRFSAIAVGIAITMLVQSSSVSTVMTIGLINASLLTLSQGLGIIFGANIGTTLTGWLMAINITAYGLPLVGVSALWYLFAKSDKYKNIASTIMGIGFIFFGLDLMNNGLKPISKMPEVIEFFKYFRADSMWGIFKVAFVGFAVTAVVQSSSATVGITIALAAQGLIDYQTSVALVLGENIGTTVTGFLASLGAQANAKRAAFAHTIFNVVGFVWGFILFKPFIGLLTRIVPPDNIRVFIAFAHSCFNIINAIIMIPCINLFAKFLCKIVKDKEVEEVRVTRLDKMMLRVPHVAADQTKAEIIVMAECIDKDFEMLREMHQDKHTISKNTKEIAAIEEKLDLYEKEIGDLNFDILHRENDALLIEKTRGNLIVSDEFETVSDYLKRIATSVKTLADVDLYMTESNINTCLALNSVVSDFFDNVKSAYIADDLSMFIKCVANYEDIKIIYKEAKTEHFSAQEDNTYSHKLTSAYSEILHFYRRAADHMYNIVEYYGKI